MNKAESRYFSTAARMDEALIACLEQKDFAYITVKEICKKAGVNRSTFYLHYETIADLLNECVEYTNSRCFQRYSSELTNIKKRLASDHLEDLIFISPEYLRPYFEFVRENKRLYQVVLQNQELFHTRHTFQRIFDDIFSPLLDRFRFPENEKPYIVHFYLGGITSIVWEWLRRDCADPIEQIVDLCMRLILPSGTEKGSPNGERYVSSERDG